MRCVRRVSPASVAWLATMLAGASGCLTSFDIHQLPHADAGHMDTVVNIDAADADTAVAPDGPADSSEASCGPCGANQDCCNGACVNITLDPDHCGSCSNACLGTTCNGGSCTGTCRMGRLDCDMNVVNGCEVNAATDSHNCGACGRACSSQQDCNGGVCACRAPLADCDGDATNGCETNTQTDPQNCGACHTPCGPGQICSAGACACATGFADCDHMAANGCEVDTRTDAMNCGSCGTSCGANSACMASACVCEPGFLRCPATAAGCTTSALDPLHCGDCATTCTGSTPVCGSTGCQSSCRTGQTLCSGGCADTGSDVSNCGACGNACPSPANAVARCTMGSCGFACLTGFADCNGLAADGCEVDLRVSHNNCGACGTACGAAQFCASGACTCPTGMRSCGGGVCAACCTNADCNDGNACTADVCTGGTCSNTTACASGTHCCGATVGCQACCSDADCASMPGNLGCGPTGACNVCAAGFRDCTAAPGCETAIATDPNNCGACMNVCSFANAAAVCSGGVCQLGMCNPGFADCDHNPSNGCETNLSNNVSNCGACGTVCPGAGAACMNGMCGFGMCPTGIGNCSGTGCNTNLNSDPNNCGGCGNVCSFPNAAALCASGTCTLGACNAGYMNCDGSASNGCETNIEMDPANCGGCRTACNLPNATASCSGGTCGIAACAMGFADCDHVASNGCEVNVQTSANDCGGCGNTCASAPNARPVCNSGSCGFTCNPNFLDCDGMASNGCEVDGTTNTSHCGLCATSCTMPSNTTMLCEGGSCGGTCVSGFGNCDGLGSNGCEAALNTTTNCGSCSNTCRAPANATPNCNSGSCGFTCNAGFGDCDGNPVNGCETDLNNTAAHCGSCTHACSGTSFACASGTCSGLCGSGRFPCSGVCVDLQNDWSNCGTCGSRCSSGQFCHSGACSSLPCPSGVACNGNCVNVATDAANCGSCGHACAANQVCASGVCSIPGDECGAGFGLSFATNPITVTGTTVGFTPSNNSCDNGNDVYYRFTLGRREIVYVDTFGSAFDTLVGIGSGCATSPTCNDNACATLQSQALAVLDAGPHYIVVDSNSTSSSGAYTLHIQHIPVTGNALGTVGTSFTVSGTTADATAANTAGSCGLGPDHFLDWVTCPAATGGTLDAAVCGAASYDTVLQLLNGDAAGGGCNDNACGLQSHLQAPVSAGAGVHVIYVDGSGASSSGTFTLTGTRP